MGTRDLMYTLVDLKHLNKHIYLSHDCTPDAEVEPTTLGLVVRGADHYIIKSAMNRHLEFYGILNRLTYYYVYIVKVSAYYFISGEPRACLSFTAMGI